MSENPGFSPPTYTPVPDELFDVWLPKLKEAELKVLLYIIRRTLGFKKPGNKDQIALSQISSGITTADGKVQDVGTGLHPASCSRAADSLAKKGLITKESTTLADGGHGPNEYTLRFKAPLLPHGNTLLPSDQPQEATTTHARVGGRARVSDARAAAATTTSLSTIYEQNIGQLTPMIADELHDIEDTYPEGWFADAVQEAVLNNARNLKYVRAILRRWDAEGRGPRKEADTARKPSAVFS